MIYITMLKRTLKKDEYVHRKKLNERVSKIIQTTDDLDEIAIQRIYDVKLAN